MSWILMTAGAAVYLGYRLLGPEHRMALRRIVLPALVLGAVSLFLGFLHSIVLRPDADPGSLLGIFITGPMGFIVGLLYGIAREKVRRPPRGPGSAGVPR